MKNKNMEILHDHYKESFTLIRDREKARDKIFLWVALLLGFLFLEVNFPSVIKEMFTEATNSGLKFNPSKAPINILGSITWAVFFIMSIRYCQLCITVERQYKYLHFLEEKISGFIGESDLYRREGKAYQDNYPVFTKWAWIFYTILFPVAILIVMTLILSTEFQHPESKFYVRFDIIMAASIALSFIFYRGVGHLKKLKKKKQKNK